MDQPAADVPTDPASPATPEPPGSDADQVDELEVLHRLKSIGLLSDFEYEVKRTQILAGEQQQIF